MRMNHFLIGFFVYYLVSLLLSQQSLIISAPKIGLLTGKKSILMIIEMSIYK